MRISYLILLFSFFTFAGHAQFTVLADDLNAPVGVRTDVYGNHWVSETGTGADDGSVVLITRDGRKIPVITGLPSFFSSATRDVRGAWHTFQLPDEKVAVIVGEGPGPKFGRVLVFDFKSFRFGHTPPKTASDAIKSIEVSKYALSLDGVTLSNPFSLATDNWGNMYVADAGANRVFKINKRDSKISVFAVIPPTKNPLPFGPPFSDAVPTKIISAGHNSFYLAQLTGFPFATGVAKIYKLDYKGRITTFASGLTAVTDLVRDKKTGNLYALQFGSFGFSPFPGFAPGSATITKINSAGGFKHTIAENFGPSSGIGLDERGNILVTELSGTLLKLTGAVPRIPTQLNPTIIEQNIAEEEISFSTYPNPVSDYLTIEWNPENNVDYAIVRLVNMTGKVVLEQSNLTANGRQQLNIQNLTSGVYLLHIKTETAMRTKKIVVKR